MQRNHRKNHKFRRFGTFEVFGYTIDIKKLLPFLVFLIIAIVTSTLLIRYAVSSSRRKAENEQLSQEYSEVFVEETTAAPSDETAQLTVAPSPLATEAPQLLRTYHYLRGELTQSAKELFAQNNDLVGWIHIDGVVDLPVVYRDNVYYLDRNFKQQKDSGGTLFLDQYHPLTEATQHLLIHGHNMHDSSMFGILASYNKLDVVKANPFARFSTLYNSENYVVFAVLEIDPNAASKGHFDIIGKAAFNSVEEFNTYVERIKMRSLFQIPIDVQPSDALLSLSTCIEDDRLVVVYRRIREGESKEELRTLVGQSVKRLNLLTE